MTLWTRAATRVRPRSSWVWFAVHVAALALQWWTISASPGLVTSSNGAGWSALCVALKKAVP
jgi:hypothetical protein